MKRFIALLLTLVMLLALSACNTTENPASVDNSGSSVPSSSTPASSTPASSTPTSSAPVTSTPASSAPSSTPDSQPSHTHSYSSSVTTAATCDKEGTKTFTCTCGDSYTEEIAALGHSFGDWQIETKAFIDKDGTEKKTCSTCSTSKTRKSTANAMANSFYDAGLPHILGENYGTLSGSSLLEYASYTFTEYADKPVAINTVFAALSERFQITDDLKSAMKEYGTHRFGYDAANDTITLHNYGIDGVGTAELVGYVHNGGNEYSTYYAYSPFADVTVYHEVKLEYNRSNGKPNKYLSFDMIDALPDGIITE